MEQVVAQEDLEKIELVHSYSGSGYPSSPLSVSQAFPITVEAGGAGPSGCSPNSVPAGATGSNSIFQQ